MTDDRLNEYARKLKTFSKVAMAAAGLAILMAYAAPAHAQQAWNTNIITWSAPTTCTTGQPITSCPVTGYRVERSPSSSGTYAAIATVTALTYTHTNVTAGVNCYRVVALSAQGNSVPSNFQCKTNTAPVGPPNPPVITISLVITEDAPPFIVTVNGSEVYASNGAP